MHTPCHDLGRFPNSSQHFSRRVYTLPVLVDGAFISVLTVLDIILVHCASTRKYVVQVPAAVFCSFGDHCRHSALVLIYSSASSVVCELCIVAQVGLSVIFARCL